MRNLDESPQGIAAYAAIMGLNFGKVKSVIVGRGAMYLHEVVDHTPTYTILIPEQQTSPEMIGWPVEIRNTGGLILQIVPVDDIGYPLDFLSMYATSRNLGTYGNGIRVASPTYVLAMMRLAKQDRDLPNIRLLEEFLGHPDIEMLTTSLGRIR